MTHQWAWLRVKLKQDHSHYTCDSCYSSSWLYNFLLLSLPIWC